MLGFLKIYSVKILLVFLLTVFNSVVTSQSNIVPLDGEPFILKNWFITKDSLTDGNLKIPPGELWTHLSSNSVSDSGNWLIKTDIIISDSVKKEKILGIFVKNIISSYEIFWDGNKIAQNGVLGSERSNEQSGKFIFNIPLPHNITSVGKHSIIVRISNHHDDSLWKWYYGGIEIGSYESGLSIQYKTYFRSFLIIGLLSVSFLFNIFLYFARNRKSEHLLFSLICFIVLLDSVVFVAPIYFNASTTFIHLQYYLFSCFTLLFSSMLPIFFIYFFSFSRKLILPIVVLNITVMVLSAKLSGILSVFNIMSLTILIISTAIVGWAVKEKRENSIVILLGIAAGWISYLFNIAFMGLATIMVICVSFSIARQFAKSERAVGESKLKSAHLENELLKKNINPHFLLNTLTSIIAWLRKEPESAIKLVEALAAEFRMINQISSLSVITIKQEVEICRTHLEIMNYRRKSNFKLETVGLIDDEPIPPMIFHTLIENGLTHGYENKTEGTFTLSRNESTNGIQYCMLNDGDFNENGNPDSSGVGSNYIKGRLEEVFSGRWDFSSHRIDSGWETVIHIRNK